MMSEDKLSKAKLWLQRSKEERFKKEKEPESKPKDKLAMAKRWLERNRAERSETRWGNDF